MEDYQDGGASRPDRPRGVNFKKIQELRDSSDPNDVKKLARKVQIFYKSHNRGVNEPLMSFSAEYLAIFSDRFRSAIWDDNVKSFTITGGDKALYSTIFEWIGDSVQQDPPAGASIPDYGESSPNIFRRYADLILAADSLSIPTRDFADKVMKSTLFKLSREKFMTWDEVDFYIDRFKGETELDEKMREIVTNSIANAWWKGNLRESDNEDEDDYCILSVLREEHSQLDQDLHRWCEKNEERIRGKWAQKDQGKARAAAGGDAGGSAEWNTGGHQAAGNGGVVGGWDVPTAAVSGDVGGWDARGDSWSGNENGRAGHKVAAGGQDDSGVGFGDSQKENVDPAELSGLDTGAMPSVAAVGGDWDDGGAGGNWAEEVNTDSRLASQAW